MKLTPVGFTFLLLPKFKQTMGDTDFISVSAISRFVWFKKIDFFDKILCYAMYFIYLCFMNREYIEKWQSQVKKGSLSFIVLLILKEKELYGYELIEKIKAMTEIDIAEGTLYPLLNRLKTDNLLESKWVEQETGIPRKYYFLSESGRLTLEEMTLQWTGLELIIKKLLKNDL